MAKVTEICSKSRSSLISILDVSPPRSGNATLLEPLKHTEPQMISVAYNPSKSVRADSVAVAYQVKKLTGIDTIFNLATRDMNRLALQSHIIGAYMLGLENLIVVRGDKFTDEEQKIVAEVNDTTTTELIKLIAQMNSGFDFKGLKLREPTNLCIGASIDLTGDMDKQVELTHRKFNAGAHFFITQAVYDIGKVNEFREKLVKTEESERSAPIFYGVQVLVPNGVYFGDIPESLIADVNAGVPGIETATNFIQELIDSGIHHIYLIPPILKGGIRDYTTTQELLSRFH